MVLLSDLLCVWLRRSFQELLLQSSLINKRKLRFCGYYVFIVYSDRLLRLRDLVLAILRLALEELRPHDALDLTTVLGLVSAR